MKSKCVKLLLYVALRCNSSGAVAVALFPSEVLVGAQGMWVKVAPFWYKSISALWLALLPTMPRSDSASLPFLLAVMLMYVRLTLSK